MVWNPSVRENGPQRCSMKRVILLVLVGFSGLSPAWTQNQPPVINGVSIGFDLFGLTYDQFVVSIEVPLASSLSATMAVGYSPAGGWQPGFEYWYLQSEIRSYQNQTHRQDLYTGFGLALYLSPNLLDFAHWTPTPTGTSSSVFGAYGLVGYKYFPNPEGGFYLDPGFMMYALAPLNLQTPGAPTKGTFFYKPAAPMANLVAGWEF